MQFAGEGVREKDRGGENIRNIPDELRFKLEGCGRDRVLRIWNFVGVVQKPSAFTCSGFRREAEAFGAVVFDEDGCVVLGSDGKGKVKEEVVDDGLIDVVDDDTYCEKNENFDDEDSGDTVRDLTETCKNKR